MDSLRLRNFRDDDFDEFNALCSDYEVVKMVSSWPFPADPDFNRMRMNTPEAQSGLVNVIEYKGDFAGTIGGVQGGIGYMLAQPFWGRGIATWAVAQKLKEGFEVHRWQIIKAETWKDNPASTAVLLKNGFKAVGTHVEYCKARDCELEGTDFEISRADWLANANRA